MSTIDERGRAAAHELRRSMDHGFDVEGGLASVLREEAVVGLQADPVRPRRTWMVLPAAAIVVAAVAGVLALRSPDDVDVTDLPPTTLPAVPVPTTSASDTTGVPEDVVETTLVPDTAPVTTAEVVERTVRVAEAVRVVEPRRSVVVSGTFGSGPGQLGIEDCQECEPARPWAPIVIPSGPRGKVLVADTANGRWALFGPENPDAAVSPWWAIEVPWPEGVGVSSQPVVDEAGMVYVVMSGSLGVGGTGASELWVLDEARSLVEPLGRYPVPSIGNLPIVLTATSVSVGDATIPGLVPTIGDSTEVAFVPADAAAGTPARITGTWQAITTTFEYEPGEFVSPYGPTFVVGDGTLLARRSPTVGEIVDRLFPDGRVVRIELPPSGTYLAAAFASTNGLLRLEVSTDGTSWEIARYALPSP